MVLRARHRRTLHAIFARPTRADVEWKDVEQLLLTLGAEVGEGRGSRVRIHLRGVRAVFHRPHPRKEIDKGSLSSLRRFLRAAEVSPESELE